MKRALRLLIAGFLGLAANTAVAVKMPGIALDNAYTNQRVKVKNLSSGKIVEGYARGAGIVEVVLARL